MNNIFIHILRVFPWSKLSFFHSIELSVQNTRTQLPTQLEPAEMQMLLPATNKNFAPLSTSLCFPSPGTSDILMTNDLQHLFHLFVKCYSVFPGQHIKEAFVLWPCRECARRGLAILAVNQKRKRALRGDWGETMISAAVETEERAKP